MKKILLISVFTCIVVFPVFAQGKSQNQGQGQGYGQGSMQGSMNAEGSEVQVQNQEQVQTQNQGDEQKLQVQTQEMEYAGESQGTGSGSQNRSQQAYQHMSTVAKKVEELLNEYKGFQVGIGKEVKELAIEQNQAQDQIENEMAKVQSRRGFMKTVFGPDYKALNNIKDHVGQNQMRIQKIQELQNQVQNQAQEQQLQETVQAMVEQNTALKAQVQEEEGARSMFGWLMRWFVR